MGRSKANKKIQHELIRAIQDDGELSDQCWILVQTLSRAEKEARRELREEGFEVYLPQRLGRKPDGSPIVLPLFPSYLFVRMTREVEQWQTLFALRAVARVVGQDGRPVGIRNLLVEEIKRREVNGLLHIGLVPGDAKVDLNDGEAIIVDGLWPGLFVSVDRRRVSVLIQTVSSDSRVTVDLSRVARA